MAKKVKTKTTGTKAHLESELDYYKAQVSDLTEYVNDREEVIEGLEEDLEAEEEVTLALEGALVDQREKYGELADQYQALTNYDSVIANLLERDAAIADEIVAANKELEQDNHHLTIQIAALKDKLKALENPPIYVRPNGTYSFDPDEYSSGFQNASVFARAKRDLL